MPSERGRDEGGYPTRRTNALVAGVAVASHLPALGNGLPLDDAYILANPAIQGLGTLPAALASPWWYVTNHLYRPLTLATFATERTVTTSAVLPHVVNLGLHALVAVLLARLVARFSGATAGTAAGLFFAVLPGHAEAVATVVGRAELLSAACMLGVMLLVTACRPATRRHFVAAAMLGAAALASKEGGVAAPVLAMAAAWLGSRSRGAAFRWGAYTALGTLALLVARLHVLGTIGGDLPNPVFRILDAAERLALALAVLPRTAAALFTPLPPPIDWVPPLAEARAPQLAWILGGVVLVGVAGALLVRHVRRPSTAGLGAWIGAATLAPTANLIFSSGVVLSGRTLYAPAMGAAVLAGVLAARALRPGAMARSQGPSRLAAARLAALAFLMACAIVTWREMAAWRSTAAAIATMQARHPDDYRSYLHLAYTARDAGHDSLAVVEFRAAADRFPGDPEMLTDAATVALRLRDTVTARRWLEQAIEASPRAARARTRLVGILVRAGDTASARRLLREGLAREPAQQPWRAMLRELEGGSGSGARDR